MTAEKSLLSEVLSVNKKGLALANFAIGMIVVFVGVVLMYVVPELVVSQITSTGVFNATVIAQARGQASSIQGLGFAVLVIGMIWMLISIVNQGND